MKGKTTKASTSKNSTKASTSLNGRGSTKTPSQQQVQGYSKSTPIGVKGS